MADEEVVVNLVYDARASAQQTVADANKVILSLDNISKKTIEVSASVAKTNDSFSGMGKLVGSIANKFEPWTVALKNATAEANRLGGMIDSLSKSGSRDTSQDALLEKSLALIPQVQKRLQELQVITIQTANAQQRLNSPAYIESIQKATAAQESGIRVGQLQAQIFGVLSAAADNYASILNHYRVELDASVVGMNSFANAQQLLSNSTNRMTGDWNEASALIVRLTEKFNPSAVAASGMTAAMLDLNQAVSLGVNIERGYGVELDAIRAKFEPAAVAAERLANVLKQFPTKINIATGENVTSATQRDITAANNQLGVNRVVNVTPDLTSTGSNQEELNGIRQRMEAEDEAARVIADDENRIITAQIRAMEASKNLTQQAQIDAYNRAQAYKQEIAELQIRAEAENVAFDNNKIKDAADRLDYLTNKYNVDATAAKNYKTTMAELNELMSTGTLSYAAYNDQVSKSIDVYNSSTLAGQKQKQSIKDVADEQEKQNKVTFLSRIGMLELQAAFVNTFQAMASGMNLTHVAMMEGAQVVGALVQGVKKIGDAFTSAFKFLIFNPFGWLIDGLLAVAAAFTLVTVRAINIQSEIRTLSVTMKTLGTDALTSATNVQKMIPQLQAVGLNRSDSASILQEVTQTQGINPQAAVLIGRVGANFAAAFGGTAVSDAKKFADALAGGVASAVKFALSVDALTGAEAFNMEEMGRHGKSMEALAEIADKVDQHLKGNLLNTMNPLTRALKDVGVAWNNFMDALGNRIAILSPLVTGFINKLTILINAASKFMNDKVTGNAAIGGVLGGAIGGIAGMAFGGFGAVPGMAIGATIGSAIMGGAGALGPGTTNNSSNLSALQSANVSNKDIQDLNQVFAQRVNDFLNAEAAGIIVNSATRFGSHPSSFNPGGTGLHNADILGQGLAVDLGNLSAGSASRLQNFGLHQTVPGDWGHIEPIEIPGANIASAASRMSAAQSFINQNSGTAQGVIDPNSIATADKAVEDYVKTLKDKLNVEQQIGMSSDLVTAKQEAENKALAEHLNPAQTNHVVALAQLDVLNRYAAQLDNTNKIQDQATRGVLNTADAARNGTQAQIQATAIQEATNTVFQKYGTLVGHNSEIQDTANRLLVKGAADAALTAQSQLNAMTPEIAAAQRLADATKLGAGAGHEQELQNQAIANTQGFANAATAAGIKINDEMILRVQKENLIRATKLDILKQTIAFENKDIQSQNDIQAMQLEISLQGRTSLEISNQVDLLKEKQLLEAAGLTPLDAEYQRRLQIVDAVGHMKIALDDATRAQQRLEDGIKSIASTIESTLTQAITDAFDPHKVQDWGKTIQSFIASTVAQITDFAFIKPLIGSILGGAGLTGAAQSFGSLGSLFGGGSTSSSGGMVTVVTPNGQGGFDTLGTLSNAASLGKSLFGDSLFGGSSGSGGFLNDIGSMLGFNTGNIVNGTGAGSGIFTDLTTGVTSDVGNVGGLFGATSFGSFLGGVGAGFGAGSLLNSLLGGNPIGGTVGSGVGSLAGGIIGSLFGGPLIGGLLGGILGGPLGGLFGGSRTPSMTTGAAITTSNANIRDFQTSGGPNQQAATQILQALSAFNKDLLNIPGASLSGIIAPQVYTNQQGVQSFKATYQNVGSFGSGEVAFSNAQDLINMLELGLAKSLKGVSSTLKTIMDSITDPSQVQAGVQFAAVYDNLKKAVDSAFSSLSADTQQVGPFQQALDQINSTFADITANAKLYGLSLAPVTAGLIEATKRLRDDVNQQVSDMILAITDPAKLAVAQLQTTGKALLDDVIAVGGDAVQAQRYNTIALEALWKSQAQTLMDLQAQLLTGSSSGLTAAGQVSAANDNFMNELKLVKGGSLAEIANLATAGNNLFSLSQSTYGNAPQTSNIRNEILSAINDVLSNRGFASGTDSTPPGFILVGEHGPEWIGQKGNMKVLPNGVNPSGMSNQENNQELIKELRAVRELLEINNRMTQGVGVQTVGKLEKISGKLDRKVFDDSKRTKVA